MLTYHLDLQLIPFVGLDRYLLISYPLESHAVYPAQVDPAVGRIEKNFQIIFEVRIAPEHYTAPGIGLVVEFYLGFSDDVSLSRIVHHHQVCHRICLFLHYFRAVVTYFPFTVIVECDPVLEITVRQFLRGRQPLFVNITFDFDIIKRRGRRRPGDQPDRTLFNDIAGIAQVVVIKDQLVVHSDLECPADGIYPEVHPASFENVNVLGSQCCVFTGCDLLEFRLIPLFAGLFLDDHNIVIIIVFCPELHSGFRVLRFPDPHVELNNAVAEQNVLRLYFCVLKPAHIAFGYVLLAHLAVLYDPLGPASFEFPVGYGSGITRTAVIILRGFIIIVPPGHEMWRVT